MDSQSGGVEDTARSLPEIVSRAYRVTESDLVGIPLGEK
jgi:hypothetical protein